MALPTKKTEIINDLSKKTIGIYGRAGIGKSTLANCFGKVLFAETEAGLSQLSTYAVSCPTYKKFLETCGEFIKGGHDYDAICIDTFDNLAKICTEWKCNELDIDDIGDYKKFGAYHLVTQELHRVIRKLSLSNYGLILTSHIKEVERTSKSKKWKRDTISVSGKNADVMLDICDILLYMDSRMDGDDEVGVIRTKPSIYWEAKDKTKKLPDEIAYPLSDPLKAYEQINRYVKGGK